MPSYEDQEFKEMATKFAKATIPDSAVSGYDIEDGRHIGVITDVGRRITTGGYRQIFIQFDIVSEGKDKGATPQAAYFLPGDEALDMPEDSEEYSRAMSNVSWFNDAFVRITGKGPYKDVGSLVRALLDGSLLRALKGRRVELQATHSKDENHYLRLRVRRGIGPVATETPPFGGKSAPKSKSQAKRSATQRKTPVRKKN